MKTIYSLKTVLIVVSLSSFLFACKKSFLEVSPKGKLIAQKVVDYDQLLNNLSVLNIDANGEGPMGDEVAAVDPYFSGTDLRIQRLFRWEDIVYEPGQYADEMIVPMRNIYLYNKIINEVSGAIDGSEEQKKSIEAEARAGRAWTYFLLINYYGKPFQSATAANDPGFPIVTEADVTHNSFTRASVKEVYDFIIKDLTAAIPNLPTGIRHRLRMSKGAAEGLLGKVYLFMGESGKALPLLTAALTGLNSLGLPVRLYDYNTNFSSGGAFFPMMFFGPNYPLPQANEEVLYLKQASLPWTLFDNMLVLTKEAADLFDPADMRLKFYSATAFSGPAYPNGLMRKTMPAGVQYGVSLPDLYLLRAECKARLDDLAGAKSDLEILRKNRMPSTNAIVPDGIAAQKISLLKFIIDERIREFALLGYRWFDMRRLSVDPLFGAQSYTHKLYTAAGAVKDTYQMKPERLVMRFPQKVMDENPGMQNNP